MAPIVEARALGMLVKRGRSDAAGSAKRAIARGQAVFSQLGKDHVADTAFGYTERQLAFHIGDTYTNMGDHAHAEESLRRALTLYPASRELDRTLIWLDRATCRLQKGEPEEALRTATDTVLALSPGQLTDIILQRARQLVGAAVAQYGEISAAKEFREALATPAKRPPRREADLNVARVLGTAALPGGGATSPRSGPSPHCGSQIRPRGQRDGVRPPPGVPGPGGPAAGRRRLLRRRLRPGRGELPTGGRRIRRRRGRRRDRRDRRPPARQRRGREMVRLRVRPDQQGQGYGAAVVTVLEERALELGYRVLRADTTVKQPVAMELYRSSGWREINRKVTGATVTVYFEKRLGT